MADALAGRCLCGAVTVRVAGAHDPRVGACHCRMCQRWSGGLFLCFEAQGVTAEGPVRTFRSSPFSERAFCGGCGSHLWFRDLDKPEGALELMPGLFDEARAWPLRSEIYTDRAMACLRLEGGHSRATRAEYEAKNPFVEGDDP
jgi:hypothetical protein